ncbi:zinc finger protein ZAT9-like [Phoenix dactylifera]|uniref:Zinc finger protein ZAT9-like n=1 Tax=Phoenix dactylifera TaxID=42345 RepID=A0A8B7CSM1_PHODC|nr:zinc finger protein ZAT9-like [Phoenix dactylifera]
MGAHPMDGGSYYQSEAAALGPEDGSVAAKQKLAKNGLRIRFKCQKACELNEEVARGALSSDWSLEGASDGDMRAHRISNGELADDRDKHIESPDHHRGDDDGFLAKMEEENVPEKAVAEDPASSESKNEDANMAAEEPPTCPECKKTFPSLKALYGHLRSHPQRGYRGANRPPEAKNKLQRGIDSSSDLAFPAAKWSVTAKRGRKGIIESNDPESNAARILLQLSRGNDLAPTPTLPREIDRLRHRNRKSILADIRIEMDEEDTKAKGLQLKDAMHSELMNGNEDDEMEAGNDGNVEASSSPSACGRKVKKKRIKDLESAANEASPPTRGRRYHCSSCNRSFSTHQALGGHRASHNKNKNNSEEVVAMDGMEADAEELVDSKGAVPRAATAEHQCTLCHASFPTGQALGGHMRRHWNGPVNHPPLLPAAPSTPAPSPAPSSSESVKEANKGLLDIDLNELPKLEAEEQMILEPSI